MRAAAPCPGQNRRSALPRLIPPLILALATVTPSIAQKSVLEAVRGIDRMGTPAYDFAGVPGAAYACTAYDAAGAPLAIATAAAGMVMFPSLQGAAVARVTCRET